MPIPGLGTWFASLILIGGLIFVVLFLITAFSSKSLTKASIIWGVILGGFLVFYVVGATWDKISRNIEENKQEKRLKAFLAKSEPYFAEKCKSAGVFIYEKDIPSQESVYIMRPNVPNSIPKDNQQYAENDFFNHPILRGYGSTLISKDIENSYNLISVKRCPYDNSIFCDYEFTFVETYVKDPSHLIRVEYILDSEGYNTKIETPINTITSRYGVTWKDISTKEDRGYWIAGGKRQIIDLQTNKVIAEVVGYVMSTNPYRTLYTSWDGVKLCPENLKGSYAANFTFSVLRSKEFLEYQSIKEKK